MQPKLFKMKRGLWLILKVVSIRWDYNQKQYEIDVAPKEALNLVFSFNNIINIFLNSSLTLMTILPSKVSSYIS